VTDPVDPGLVDARHLTLSNVDRFWGAGLAMQIPVPGSPQCSLLIDPKHDEISLVTPLDGPEPDVAKYRNIALRTFADDDGDWAEIQIAVQGALHGAFSVLATIADRLQLQGETLGVAVPYAVAAHRGVFASRAGLTRDKEVGLFGELLLLEYLIKELGASVALKVWAGPLSEEHDFVFEEVHFEVKTTTSERRRHIIGTAQQLAPLQGIPLWLMSIQITVSSGDLGRTLPRLVAAVRLAVGGHRAALDARLRACGWMDDEGDLYTTVWAYRTTPRAFLVHKGFPAITQRRLAQVVPQVELVSDVSYRVDVTDMDPGSPPSPLAGFVETLKGSTQ